MVSKILVFTNSIYLQAEDSDKDINGKIQYQVLPGSGATRALKRFYLDSTNGLVGTLN